MKVFLMFVFLVGSYITLFAQHESDRHSTNYFDAWISCEEKPSPSNKWGNRHWVQYEFEAIYVLGQLKLWNYNDREHNGIGIRDVIIDYSLDGETWEEWGLYTFDKAPVNSFYRGVEGPDLGGIEAKFLLFTVLSNYGGGPCAGFAELKIETEGWSPNSTTNLNKEENLILFPNPTSMNSFVSMKLKSLEPLNIVVLNLLGERVREWDINPKSLNFRYEMEIDNLVSGSYFLYVRQNDKVSNASFEVIK